MRNKPSRSHVLTSVGSLETDNTFAGAMIGDNWVVMAIAHADRMGMVFPMRMRRAFFSSKPGEDPDPAKIGEALQQCWTGLGASAAFEYSKFMLCLPARITHSRQSEATVSTHPTGPFRTEHSVVKSEHLRQLQKKVSRDGFWPRYAVCDLIPLWYALDDRRTTANPVGRQAERMAMQAHLVLGEHEIVRGILDQLRMMDINVDLMVSPHTASAGVLSPDECNSRTIAIDIDRLTTTCTFFKDGKIVHSEWVEGGSYSILEGAAQRLNTEPEELALWLNEREDLVRPTAPDDDMLLPLYPRWRRGVASLVDLDQAARKAGSGIVTQLQAVIETAASRLGLAPQRAVLMGDDSLTLRAMMSSLYQGGLICEWRNPRDEHVQSDSLLAMPGMARFVGMMRMAHQPIPRQPYLEDYGETFGAMTRIQQAMPEPVQRWMGSSPVENTARGAAPKLNSERGGGAIPRGRLGAALKGFLF